MTQTKNIFRVAIWVILIAVILNLVTCSKSIKPFIIKSLGGYTQSSMTVTVDTLSKKIDSIFFKYDSIRTIVKSPLKPEIIYKYVPKYINIVPNSSTPSIKGNQEVIDSVFVYNQAISDSVINGNIKTIVNLTNCKIVEQSLEYTPKIPIIVRETITIEKKIETVKENVSKIGIGGIADNTQRVGILLAYQTKKKWQYQAFYSKDVSINPSQKNVIGISVIKFF